MNEKPANIDAIFVLIESIPLEFHTPDLRNFFSYAIETLFFDCFNYRHRPHQTEKFNTCICKVKANKFDHFTKLYNNKNWIDQRGRIHSLRCSIVKVKPSKDDASSREKLSENDLNSMLEFRNIPKWMPQGNVGTPTKTFVEYINQCAMPTSLIAKLGVNLKTFKKHKKKAYSNVEYKYEGSAQNNDNEDDPELDETVSHMIVASTANGHRIVEELEDEKEIREKNYSNERQTNVAEPQKEDQDDQEADDNDGDELEDWERHESLHDDVTKQDRTSPYFFEHEIELKWEKGGSGLVFYTDDNFWKDLENKDFDAETADDLDVDMSGYYDANAGDKDARDMLEMRRMEMLRSGASSKQIDDQFLKSYKKLNSFRTPTASAIMNPPVFGRKQLEKLGWREGKPVGDPNRSGLIEPLDASEGKHPFDKRGLGFYGDKIDKEATIKAQKQRQDRERRNAPYFIGSKYDQDLDSTSDSLLRRVEHPIKYRSSESTNDDSKI